MLPQRTQKCGWKCTLCSDFCSPIVACRTFFHESGIFSYSFTLKDNFMMRRHITSISHSGCWLCQSPSSGKIDQHLSLPASLQPEVVVQNPDIRSPAYTACHDFFTGLWKWCKNATLTLDSPGFNSHCSHPSSLHESGRATTRNTESVRFPTVGAACLFRNFLLP